MLAAVSDEWRAAQVATNLSAPQRKQHNALVAAEILRLRVAYPTQARSFSAEEVAATNALWAEIFAGVDPDLLREAVMRFIVADRKGYFPAPGQIVGAIEQIVVERNEVEKRVCDGQELRRLCERVRQAIREEPEKTVVDKGGSG
jgi:hypothetical protein